MPDPTAANLLPFFTGLKNKYYQAYAGTEVWHPQLTMPESSDTELETYGWMDRLPAMEEWIGPRTVNEPISQFRALVNKHFVQTSSISANKFKDDKHGIYSHIVEEHARQAAKQHDYQIQSLIEANPVGFDGVTFFNTAHPTDTTGQLSSATQSNDLTTLALNPSNWGTARQTMRAFVGRDGKPFGTYPNLLVVPVQLEEQARVLRDASFFSPQTFGGSTTNVGNVENIYKGTFEVLVVPELTKPKVWYPLYTKSAIRPFLVQLREAINMQFLVNPNDPNVFWLREFVWGADMRSAYDVTVWWMALRCGNAL